MEKRNEFLLCGELIKIGEKFCFPDLNSIDPNLVKTTKSMVDRIGSGPFELLDIEFYPRDGHPLYMLTFLDQKGEQSQITSEYFVKFHEGEKSIILPHEDGCIQCQEEYQKLISELTSMHLASATDPAELCSASFHDFEKNHPMFPDLLKKQDRLYYLASKHGLAWVR